jgi:nucleotide-binding universal stress UspA family protein
VTFVILPATPRAGADRPDGAPQSVDAGPPEPTYGGMSTRPRSGAERPVIVCHDGSREATDALDYTATLVPGAPVLVVTIWKPPADEALSPATRPPPSDPGSSADVARRSAQQIAAEAARRASTRGLDAEPLAIEAHGAMWEAIEEAAVARDALLVVCGTSRSGMRSTLPGNLAHGLVMHVSRPVLVVPSAKAAAERRHEAEERRHAQRPFAAQRR